jgi:TetR/AcrR family transcriptional regulator of autoinduction and epiphytic fitness
VSVKRAYSSARREAQARETRRSVLDAAYELFVATGYAATTIQAIAERGGVAVQTVYAAFGSKRELLRQLIEQTIVGDADDDAATDDDADDDQVPITERPAAQTIAAEPDPRRRAELDAAISRSITERIAPIVRVAAEASASDPELAEMMEAVKAARRQEMTTAARILAGPDRQPTDPEHGAATLYVLYSPQVADMLIGDYGWSPDRYEKWLARMILQAVIGDTSPGQDPTAP